MRAADPGEPAAASVNVTGVFVIGLYAQQVLPRWAAPALSAERAL
jgi:hypothetical protein